MQVTIQCLRYLGDQKLFFARNSGAPALGAPWTLSTLCVPQKCAPAVILGETEGGDHRGKERANPIHLSIV